MYPAKILLFGEYTILLNSQALAIPYSSFKGELTFKVAVNRKENIEQTRSNLELKKFCSYYEETNLKSRLTYKIDFESFNKDIENGLFFNSDIPVESGLGSSGALVAAVFDKYSETVSPNRDIQMTRNSLALMESYYHGKSSGIDPLVSYLKTPLLIQKDELIIIPNPQIEEILKDYGLFLINSKLKAATGDLMKKFDFRCKSDCDFLDKIYHDYFPVLDECINSLTKQKDAESFFSAIGKLSTMQLDIFNEMIPQTLRPLINYGLENNLFYLKLCGSGGGGYFLGFTKNKSETGKYLNEMGYDILFY
jgi:mevalonate kinase